MITVGVDPHKSVHHAVAVDELGKALGSGGVRIVPPAGQACGNGRAGWRRKRSGGLKGPGATGTAWPSSW